MGIGRQSMTSSYSIILDTDTFILIKDNDDPEFASVSNAADYTVESLAQLCGLSNRRIVCQDTTGGLMSYAMLMESLRVSEL